MYNLNKKVAIVTGAGSESGIGRAIAVKFAKEGAEVIVNDLKANQKTSSSWSGFPDVVKEIESLGRNALGVEADVTDAKQVAFLIQRAIEKFGKIDILVNNAAVPADSDRVPIVELDEEIWDLVQRVNVKGTFLCSREVAKVLIKQKHGGKIINMSSTSGKQGVAKFGAYCASKFAVRGLTQVLAKELGPHGIQVNALCPGLIFNERQHDIARALAPEGVAPEDFLEEMVASGISKTPLGRTGTTWDVAQAAAFLASSESDFLTGVSLNVDGGMAMD